MQAVNQLSRPSGKIRSNVGYKLTKPAQPAKRSFVRYRYSTAAVAYLVLAIGLISACVLDNGYLLKETITVFIVIGLVMVLRLFGKDVESQLPEPKTKNF